MAECSECGKQSMSFKCKYCGEKFCSTHRLPEKHNCQSMDKKIEQEKQETDEWFKEQKVKNPAPSAKKPPKRSLGQDVIDSLKNNVTLSIIGLTTLAFLLQVTFGTSLTSEPLSSFVLQSQLSDVIAQPWTLFTVMLMHGSTFHLFANMITLYFFGRPIENLTGSIEFLKFYVLAGLGASIGFIAFTNLTSLYLGSQVFGPAVGASGAVVAAFAAVAMLYPKAEVLLYFIVPMKIKTALYGFAAIEGVNLLAKAVGIYLPVIGGFASSAHLAGMAIGVWYGKRLREKSSRRSGTLNLFGA